MVKNCDLGLENAQRSQFFTIPTSQPANNIYIYIYIYINQTSDENKEKYQFGDNQLI